MDTLLQKALEIEEALHSRKDKAIPYASYGRGVEQASALGLWFVAYTLSTSTLYTAEVLAINPYLLGYLAAVLGLCQLIYHKVVQRVIFTILASAFWLSLSLYAFIEAGDWNLTTAACLPFAIFNFYIYGFVYEAWKRTREG